jgi:hypothetical protein
MPWLWDSGELTQAVQAGQLVAGWDSMLSDTPESPRAYRAEDFPEAKGVRNALMRPVIETWLAHGDTRLHHTHAAVPGRAPIPAPAAVPALPPAASPPALRR